ncbi:MAG: hypothetical protein PF904_00315 [Kiritimatiellae bacterium]|jgi:hypothetical protein|nr:hypothetical protein [Kiritimatiellia bacterium]
MKTYWELISSLVMAIAYIPYAILAKNFLLPDITVSESIGMIGVVANLLPVVFGLGLAASALRKKNLHTCGQVLSWLCIFSHTIFLVSAISLRA